MIRPGSVIGILGGGQLGRMSALAAAHLGFRTAIYAPEPDPPAARVAWRSWTAGWEDADALARFAAECDVVTLEWENVPQAALDVLAPLVPLRPGPQVLAVARDRRAEKRLAASLGQPTAPWEPAGDAAAIRAAGERLGWPAILKLAGGGFDGRGQIRIDGPDQAEAARAALPGPAILEGLVDLALELSVILARRPSSGEIAAFPVMQNRHEDGILRETLVPAAIPAEIAAQALTMAEALAVALDLEGLLTVEFFLDRQGLLRVNELAPRPHNSGHWSLDAATVSQFEQHIRAVADWPLARAEALCPARMLNLLGEEAEDWARWLEDPLARLRLYDKGAPRPGRKMGHVTLLGA